MAEVAVAGAWGLGGDSQCEAAALRNGDNREQMDTMVPNEGEAPEAGSRPRLQGRGCSAAHTSTIFSMTLGTSTTCSTSTAIGIYG